MSVLSENDSCRLSKFLQTHIFWNFDDISRIYNQINYRNTWFLKVIIILIMMTQVLFSMFFSEKDLHLNAVENRIELLNTVNHTVFPWTLTSLKSFSSVWVLQQTHKGQWFHIVLPQNFHQSLSHGISEFCFPIFFCKFWFLIKRIQSEPYWSFNR